MIIETNLYEDLDLIFMYRWFKARLKWFRILRIWRKLRTLFTTVMVTT